MTERARVFPRAAGAMKTMTKSELIVRLAERNQRLVARDADEAVRMANDTPYGLGAAVFGPEPDAADVAARLSAGMVGINQGCGGAHGTPWVGARQSGLGYHSGREGHRQFAQVRVLSRQVRRPATA